MARILLADDHQLVREALKALLEQEGYTVFEAQDGTDAAALLRTETVDILVTDVFMPVMDGIELIRYVREEDMDIKVLAISGGGAYQKAGFATGLAERSGADKTLSKPFDNDELLACVSALAG